MSTTADQLSGDTLEHHVSDAPFDPYSIEALSPEQERYFLASQWMMMVALETSQLAVAAGLVLLAMYASIIISEVISPYNLPPVTPITCLRCRMVRLFHEGEFIGPLFMGWITSSTWRT